MPRKYQRHPTQTQHLIRCIIRVLHFAERQIQHVRYQNGKRTTAVAASYSRVQVQVDRESCVRVMSTASYRQPRTLANIASSMTAATYCTVQHYEAVLPISSSPAAVRNLAARGRNDRWNATQRKTPTRSRQEPTARNNLNGAESEKSTDAMHEGSQSSWSLTHCTRNQHNARHQAQGKEHIAVFR